MGRRLRRALAGLAILPALAVVGTLLPRPLFPMSAFGDAQPTQHILLLSNPIHTDIAVPIDAGVLDRFAPLLKAGIRADLPLARYIVFGRGGRAFYTETPTWADLKPGPLFLGLTLDDSVIHVDVSGAISEPQPEVHAFDLSDAEFGRLLEFIEGSFNVGPDGAPVRIPDVAYGEFDAFFEGRGYFTALLGCNTWTAQALRESGIRTGWWNPLPQSLALSVRLYN